MKKTIKTESTEKKTSKRETIAKSIKAIDAEKKVKYKKAAKKTDTPKPVVKKIVKKSPAVRDRNVTIRVNVAELKKIQTAAKKAKMHTSTYIRSKVLG